MPHTSHPLNFIILTIFGEHVNVLHVFIIEVNFLQYANYCSFLSHTVSAHFWENYTLPTALRNVSFIDTIFQDERRLYGRGLHG